MKTKNIVPQLGAVKQISSRSSQAHSKQQRSLRRPRPHGKPRPDRYRSPARYMLDVGRNISLALTLERHKIAPNATTLTKIGGGE